MSDKEEHVEIKKGYTPPEPPEKPVEEGYVPPRLPEEPPKKPPKKED
jgi:hypothetical protein